VFTDQYRITVGATQTSAAAFIPWAYEEVKAGQYEAPYAVTNRYSHLVKIFNDMKVEKVSFTWYPNLAQEEQSKLSSAYLVHDRNSKVPITIDEFELLEFSNSVRLPFTAGTYTYTVPGSQFNRNKGSGYCDTETTFSGRAPNGIASHYRPGGTLFRLYLNAAASASMDVGQLIVRWQLTFRGSQPEASV
jgi:hypothetical protein